MSLSKPIQTTVLARRLFYMHNCVSNFDVFRTKGQRIQYRVQYSVLVPRRRLKLVRRRSEATIFTPAAAGDFF